MAEYIERETVKAAIGFVQLHCVRYGENKSLLDVINEIPAADVAPVRHGRWKLVGADRRGRGGEWKCDGRDGCGKLYPHKCYYCPNCGAIMDGGEDIDRK